MATAALQRETRTIPIVFVSVSDPVGLRLRCQPSTSGSEHHWRARIFKQFCGQPLRGKKAGTRVNHADGKVSIDSLGSHGYLASIGEFDGVAHKAQQHPRER